MTAPKLTEAQQRRALQLLVKVNEALAARIDIADENNVQEMAAAMLVSGVRKFLQSTAAGRAALRGES